MRFQILQAPLLKTDQKILTKIRAASKQDRYGFGLELDEICLQTSFKKETVLESLKRLNKKKLIVKTKSYVANHIFFCDPEQLSGTC